MGHGVGQAVAPHFDPDIKVRFSNKKTPKTKVFDAFWSCWADLNRRPHPYQKAMDAFVPCPFMPIKVLQFLVLQGVGGLFAVEKFYWIPIWIMWI